MTLLWAGLVILGVAAVTITAMLLVRRTAPAGSYFEDGDRAASVFGVLSTGFATLLGFVVFSRSRATAAFAPWRWNGRSSSSTWQRGPYVSSFRLPATRREEPTSRRSRRP